MSRKIPPQTISRRTFLGLTAAGVLAGCFPARPRSSTPRPPASPDAYFPSATSRGATAGNGGASWRTSTPEEQGIDSQGIAAMLKEISRSTPYMHSFLLVRNGWLVTEAYFAPVTRDLGHYLFSATKSVTSALVGIAIQDGLLKGPDQKVLDIFPEMEAKNAAGPSRAGQSTASGAAGPKVADHLRQLTLEHLLTMSTGHVDYLSPNPYEPTNWVEKFLADSTNTLIEPPGQTFLYTSGAAHTLSAIIQKVTGRTTAAYAAEKLFGPLGMKDYTWLADQHGISFGNSWLRLRPLDMAKFGYLYLNQGLWDGVQVVPKAWVEQSTRKHIETQQAMFNSAEKDGYGYLWWLNGFGGYSAHGYGGQFIFILPEHSLVAVFTGGFDDSLFDTGYQLFKSHILPAVQAAPAAKKDAASQAAYQALTAWVDQAGSPLTKAVGPLPATAARISGKTYRFADGTTFTVTFDGSPEYRLKVVYSDASASPGITQEYRGGLDGAYRLNTSHDPVLGDSILGVKGGWLDETTFVQSEFLTDNVSTRTFTLHYQGSQLTINAKDDISGKSTFNYDMEATLAE